jgi:hypothetical protein
MAATLLPPPPSTLLTIGEQQDAISNERKQQRVPSARSRRSVAPSFKSRQHATSKVEEESDDSSNSDSVASAKGGLKPDGRDRIASWITSAEKAAGMDSGRAMLWAACMHRLPLMALVRF